MHIPSDVIVGLYKDSHVTCAECDVELWVCDSTPVLETGRDRLRWVGECSSGGYEHMQCLYLDGDMTSL